MKTLVKDLKIIKRDEDSKYAGESVVFGDDKNGNWQCMILVEQSQRGESEEGFESYDHAKIQKCHLNLDLDQAQAFFNLLCKKPSEAGKKPEKFFDKPVCAETTEELEDLVSESIADESILNAIIPGFHIHLKRNIIPFKNATKPSLTSSGENIYIVKEGGNLRCTSEIGSEDNAFYLFQAKSVKSNKSYEDVIEYCQEAIDWAQGNLTDVQIAEFKKLAKMEVEKLEEEFAGSDTEDYEHSI